MAWKPSRRGCLTLPRHKLRDVARDRQGRLHLGQGTFKSVRLQSFSD